MVTQRINRTWGSTVGAIVLVVIAGTAYVGYRATWQPVGSNAPVEAQNADLTTGGPIVIMIAHYSGGMCVAADGGGVCTNTYRILSDGTFEHHTPLTREEVSQLRATIDATDFMAYARQQYSTCPSAYDGLDLSVEFPLKYTDGRQFMPCRLQIPQNDAGLTYIQEVIAKHEWRE